MASFSFKNIYYSGILIGGCEIFYNTLNSFLVGKVPLRYMMVVINFVLLIVWGVLVVLNLINFKSDFLEFIEIGTFFGWVILMFPIVYLYPSKIFPAEHRGTVNSLIIAGSQMVAAFFPFIGSIGTNLGQDDMIGCTAILLLSAPLSLGLKPIKF